jgi:hypothetical protein
MADTKILEVRKKVYTKPLLSEVRLVAEEAVLALCKFNNGVQNTCEGDQSCIATQRS